MTQKTSNKHLPLTEASYYILLALVTPNHGYAVMQEAEVVSQGTVRLAPGTIYGALAALETGKLITMVGTEGRRKIYQVTELGKQVLREQIHRYQIMLENAVNKSELWAANTTEEGEIL
ncbi:MAG: PadR family transcriptional regulator [Chloroflexota bacterium]|nr:MAG: PadR family transcriptional regulator [Chloroflexota bacterium]